MLKAGLRPFLPTLGAAGVASFLRAWPLAAAAPDAGLVQTAAALQVTVFPFTLPAAILLGLLARAADPVRVRRAGALLGLALVFVPELAALGGAGVELPLALGLLVGTLLGLAVWARRGGATRALPAGHLLAAVGLFGVLVLPAGVLLPGPVLAIGSLGEDRAAHDGPNLALLVLDTVRADRLGCYGCERDTSPYLDSLAARGVLFTRAVSTASHTPPGHAGMFTGKLPSEHGVMSSASLLPWNVDVLAEELREAGYHTGGVVSNFNVRRSRGFGRGFEVFDDTLVCSAGLAAGAAVATSGAAAARTLGGLKVSPWGGFTKGIIGWTRTRSQVHAERTNAMAMPLLREMAARDRPFFLFVNYMDAHTPYQAPGEAMDRFLEHDPGRFDGRFEPLAFTKRMHAVQQDLDAGKDVGEELLALRDRYDAEIAYLDAQLRPVVEQLEAASGDRGWLLIVTSDHGEHFGEHGELDHGKGLHEPVLRVPLLVVGSGLDARQEDTPASTLDVAGTLLGAAGLTTIGRSRDLLAGLDRPPGHVAAEHGDPRGLSAFGPLLEVAVYEQAYKYRWVIDDAGEGLGEVQVYAPGIDPGESAPLALPLPAQLFDWTRAWWEGYRAGRKNTKALSVDAAESIGLNEMGYATDEDRP